MTWSNFAGDGRRGTEGGEIIADHEHNLGVRITLERGGKARFAITCGIYGWMVHTRFFDTEAEARQQYAAMQGALDEILALVSAYDDPPDDAQIDEAARELAAFVDRFP
jgi:hypothetical protein